MNNWAANLIQKESGAKLYAIENWRQADSYSCHIDALILGRDVTAKNKETNTYRVPELLAYLEHYSRPSSAGLFYSVTQLPPELLKTAQSSEFMKNYRDDSQRFVHQHKGQNETLEEFRERYTDKDISILHKLSKKREVVDISRYLRKKGIQSADIIEMRFYLNYIEKTLGYPLDEKARMDFVQGAKKGFHKQAPAYENRIGIQQFTEHFLLNYKKEQKFS